MPPGRSPRAQRRLRCVPRGAPRPRRTRTWRSSSPGALARIRLLRRMPPRPLLFVRLAPRRPPEAAARASRVLCGPPRARTRPPGCPEACPGVCPGAFPSAARPAGSDLLAWAVSLLLFSGCCGRASLPSFCCRPLGRTSSSRVRRPGSRGSLPSCALLSVLALVVAFGGSSSHRPFEERGEGLPVGGRSYGRPPGLYGHGPLLPAALDARAVPAPARQVDELLLADTRDGLVPAAHGEGVRAREEALVGAAVVAHLFLGVAEKPDRLLGVGALLAAGDQLVAGVGDQHLLQRARQERERLVGEVEDDVPAPGLGHERRERLGSLRVGVAEHGVNLVQV